MTQFQTQDPSQPTRGEQLANVHDYPWYWRLRELFGLNRHALSSEEDPQTAAEREGLQLQEWFMRQFQISTNRQERYRIFEEMDTFDLVQAVMDVYAEECTQKDYDKGRAVWIESRHSHMVHSGDVCLANAMLEDRLFQLVRQTCVMGDSFRRLLYQAGKGVLGWKYAAPPQCHRVEDKYDRLIGFRQDGHSFRGRKHPVSFPWDYVHFRLMGKEVDTVYGSSACAPLFRSWRQLVLFEDSDLMYNLRRAASRNLVLVDTGDLDDVEATERLNRWRKRMKKHEFIDPASPSYKKSYNPLTPLEDIFVAIRGPDDQTRIENLEGSPNPLSPERMDYYRKKFCGVARIPGDYLGWGEDSDAKSTLLQKDVRFARTMKRVQKMAIYGVRNLLDIHYSLFSGDPDRDVQDQDKYDVSKNPYLVCMSPISYLDEWERLELVQLRYSIIEAMAGLGQSLQIDVHAWTTYILLHYAKLPEDIVRLLTKRVDNADAAGGGMPPGSPSGSPGLFGAAPGGNGAPPASGGPAGPGEEFDLNNDRFGLHGNGRRRLLTEVERKWGAARKGMDSRRWSSGFYEPNEAEQKRIAEAIHASPKLRKLIGDFAEFHSDDELTEQQTDFSTLPPRILCEEFDTVSNCKVYQMRFFSDDVAEDDEAKILKEDIARLNQPVLTEGRSGN